MALTLEQDAAGSLIVLAGLVEISSSAELKGLLVEALGSGMPVRVSLGNSTDLDVTAVQLLWAAAREAQRANLSFTLACQPPEAVLAVLAQAGFEKFPVTVDAG